jgi:hypothetical protein
MGIGGLLSTIVMASLAVRARLSSAIAAGTTLLFAGLVLIAATPGDVTALAGLAAVGAGNVLADVGLITMLQRVVPEEVLARVFGIAGGALIGMVGLGALLGPTLRESFGGRPALAITAALPAITIALAWRKLRGVDHHDQDHIDRVALLRQVPTFAPLPNDTLSELEAALRPIHATAGEEIVRQGDQGNDYFVVAAGVCESTIDGHPVALHGPGDGFGEIALLRDTPRSATVTASEDSELYALNRTTFLALLAGHASAAAAAEGIAARRLARLRPGAP